MTAPASAREHALSDTIDVETPELVVLSYTPAGVGSRVAAALIDYLLCALFLVALLWTFTLFSVHVGVDLKEAATGTWVFAVLTLFQFAILWLYYVLFEALMDGQTPGKRVMNLRVVRDGGLSVTFGASAIRNLVRLIDMQPGIFYLTGIISIVATRSGKRLGDLAAGTIVVREALISQPVARVSPARNESGAALHARLTDAELDVLDRFMARWSELDAGKRAAFAGDLARRFSASLADFTGSEFARLSQLHDAERDARARGLAARNDTGAARERHAIVAASAARWSRFAERIASAQSGGLSKLGEAGVRDFVQEYREATADLARLRTATRGRDANEVFYLNRLVASAHNLLYRRTDISPRSVVDYLFVTVPREIRASWKAVTLAAAILFLPMIVACTAVVVNPDVAERMLPPAMLDRAERGVESARVGGGYIEDPELLRPVFASRIITNNVQVAFFAFATGITAGVFTLWILITNGVSIGAVFGLYISKGIGSLLLAFVAPHGVFELTAIAIAGGAGLLLASAILLPGDRTRRRALVENARRAIQLIAGATFLLLAAGVLEGFVSPNNRIPLQSKLMISAATAVSLVVYLVSGTGLLKARRAPSVPDNG